MENDKSYFQTTGWFSTWRELTFDVEKLNTRRTTRVREPMSLWKHTWYNRASINEPLTWQWKLSTSSSYGRKWEAKKLKVDDRNISTGIYMQIESDSELLYAKSGFAWQCALHYCTSYLAKIWFRADSHIPLAVAQSHYSDLLPWYPLQIMALAIHVSLVCSRLVTKFFHVLWRYLMLHGPSITWILPDHVDFLRSSPLPNTF